MKKINIILSSICIFLILLVSVLLYIRQCGENKDNDIPIIAEMNNVNIDDFKEGEFNKYNQLINIIYRSYLKIPIYKKKIYFNISPEYIREFNENENDINVIKKEIIDTNYEKISIYIINSHIYLKIIEKELILNDLRLDNIHKTNLEFLYILMFEKVNDEVIQRVFLELNEFE